MTKSFTFGIFSGEYTPEDKPIIYYFQALPPDTKGYLNNSQPYENGDYFSTEEKSIPGLFHGSYVKSEGEFYVFKRYFGADKNMIPFYN